MSTYKKTCINVVTSFTLIKHTQTLQMQYLKSGSRLYTSQELVMPTMLIYFQWKILFINMCELNDPSASETVEDR